MRNRFSGDERGRFIIPRNSLWLVVEAIVVVAFLSISVVEGQGDEIFNFAKLSNCNLTSREIALLGKEENIEPCIIADVQPDASVLVTSKRSAVVTMIHLSPTHCGNHRDGSVTGIESLNQDNDGRGVAIGFKQDFYVRFRLVSVVAGNPAFLGGEEYERRHVLLLNSMLKTISAQYIVGSCSFVSKMEKQPALDHKTIVLAQVGPPGFYMDNNPYVFGFHVNSDTYPLHTVRNLNFYASKQHGPAKQPVSVIYRTKSEFFYSTCRSAIDLLHELGFNDTREILYDHEADDDQDGVTNQFDEDFLIGLADQACPASNSSVGTVESSRHPALFMCTLTEQDVILKRFQENRCRPTSIWFTASTWGWATYNPDTIPYYQGGGQWHRALSFGDRYFDNGYELLLYNEKKFGYMGTYDMVVSYAIPIFYSLHLQAAYRVVDDPDPMHDFSKQDGYERLRRAMMVLNVETIFGRVSFNSYQRNIGRNGAGTQWLPDPKVTDSFRNALVAPLSEAEEASVIPAASSVPCHRGYFINDTMVETDPSLLKGKCSLCPVDFFMFEENHNNNQCNPCPAGSTTNGMKGQFYCFSEEENLLSPGILAFGYLAVAITWILSLSFMVWVFRYRKDAVVRIAQIEFLVIICIGTMISSLRIISISFQAGNGEDTSLATAGCRVAPFCYAIGWVLEYSSLSVKSYRLYKIMNNPTLQRVNITFGQTLKIVLVAFLVDLGLVLIWTIKAPLTYVRMVFSTDINEDIGVITQNTVGKCTMGDDESVWIYMSPLIVFHVLLIFVTNFLLFKVRNISDRYQEQKYVFFASVFVFEILVVGSPILAAADGDNFTTVFIVLTAIVGLNDIGILCFIFIPKIKFQRKGIEEGVGVGQSIIKSDHKKAVARASQYISEASVLASQDRSEASVLASQDFFCDNAEGIMAYTTERPKKSTISSNMSGNDSFCILNDMPEGRSCAPKQKFAFSVVPADTGQKKNHSTSSLPSSKTEEENQRLVQELREVEKQMEDLADLRRDIEGRMCGLQEC